MLLYYDLLSGEGMRLQLSQRESIGLIKDLMMSSPWIIWILERNDPCHYTGKTTWREEERSHEDDAEIWVKWPPARKCSEILEAGREEFPLNWCVGGIVLLTPWFWNSGLQSCENNTFLLF